MMTNELTQRGNNHMSSKFDKTGPLSSPLAVNMRPSWLCLFQQPRGPDTHRCQPTSLPRRYGYETKICITLMLTLNRLNLLFESLILA